MRGRSVFGLLMLIVVMAVVLMLVAKAWQRFGGDAVAVTGVPGVAVTDGGETEAAGELESGELPRLQDAQERTDAHAAEVQNALDAIE